MPTPFRRVALLVLLATGLAAPAARAATQCVDVPGIGPEIAKFLDEVNAGQAAGQGSFPLIDVFFGVTKIAADDLQALDQREPVHIVKRDETGGDYVNRGPKKITVDGLFADETTFFRVPKQVAGRYVMARKGSTLYGVTLNYDPAHTVELGAEMMGMRFFKPIHHSVITRDGVSFFLDANSGPDPDRCYRAVAG
jgi:hypothetical protein